MLAPSMHAIAQGGATTEEVATLEAPGDRIASGVHYAGHYTTPYSGFPPPGGQGLSFRAATLFDLADGLVVRTSEFYDLYGLLVQMGLLPPPGGQCRGGNADGRLCSAVSTRTCPRRQRPMRPRSRRRGRTPRRSGRAGSP